MKYSDAAGNKAEKVLEKGAADAVVYTVNKDNLALQIGGTEQLTVTETTTKPDGTTEVIDVTAKATFQSANAAIATVNSGKVTALAAGETTITVSYKDFTQTIPVKVTANRSRNQVTYTVNKTNLTLGIDQQEQLIVTETTTKPDGTVTEKDVTAKGSYSSANSKIATIKKGLVTAKGIGTTQLRIQLPGQQLITVDVEVKVAPQDIVTYAVNKTSLTLGVGQQEQLVVTEITIRPDGTVIEKDVTGKRKLQRRRQQIATVQKGLVNAKENWENASPCQNSKRRNNLRLP